MLDVSKPDAPVERSAYDVSGSNPGRGIAYRAGLTVGVTYNAGAAPDLFVLDSPYGGSLRLLSSLNLQSDNSGVALYGRRAFVSTRHPATGLRIVDVSIPASPPVIRGSLATGENANAVAVRDSLPFLATSGNTLELLVAHGGIRVEPVLTDVNGDGQIATSCLGDENTQSPSSPLRFWCEGLDDLITRPSWRTRNQAAPGATVYPRSAAPADGPTQLASALAFDAPDAVVLAFGTADIPFMISVGQIFNVPPPIEAILLSYRDLAASAAASRVKAFIALTPPQGTSSATQVNELVSQLNNRLRHEFPGEQLIDFAAPMVAGQDYLPGDLDHMNQSGQSKRAAAARHELEN